MHFDLLIDRRFNKKPILISSIYNLYLEVKSEDTEFISKIFNEKYNIIYYNENYKKWKQYQSRIKKVWGLIKLSVELHFVVYISNYFLSSEYYK
jgi:hypothetical protein